MAESEKTAAGSQTLARGLAALAMIGESDTPITVRELAERLGIHRSMVYRLVATLEQSGFVERTGGGELQIGIRLVGIARTAARDLQTVALPELLAAADELDATVFLAAYDGEAAVTLVSAEPRNAHAVVAQRPGSRHPIGRGAPARVIRSQVDPVAHPPARFEESHDEVYAGSRRSRCRSSCPVDGRWPSRRCTSRAARSTPSPSWPASRARPSASAASCTEAERRAGRVRCRVSAAA